MIPTDLQAKLRTTVLKHIKVEFKEFSEKMRSTFSSEHVRNSEEVSSIKLFPKRKGKQQQQKPYCNPTVGCERNEHLERKKNHTTKRCTEQIRPKLIRITAESLTWKHHQKMGGAYKTVWTVA